jgi:hypothetical protein
MDNKGFGDLNGCPEKKSPLELIDSSTTIYNNSITSSNNNNKHLGAAPGLQVVPSYSSTKPS